MKMTIGQALLARKGGHNPASARQPKGLKGKNRTLVKRKPIMRKRDTDKC